MPRPRASAKKDIILFVSSAPLGTLDLLHAYARDVKEKFRTAVIYDPKQNKPYPHPQEDLNSFDIKIPVNLKAPDAIQLALVPYLDNLFAITCRGESDIPEFQKVVPHVPYVRTPSTESLQWTTDKILMRRRLFNHNKKIAPAFTVVRDATPQSLDNIEKKVGFPLIVKPAGLASSLLVSVCYHEEELENALKRTFRRIKRIYKETSGRGEPQILVEQFMDGEMYSIDAYVGSRGKAYFCPLVHVKTGRSIGFDDFFGYQRIVPSILSKASVAEAEIVAAEGVKALGLRSVTCHIELMRTEDGWKVIEIGPRIGGFRHVMYQLSYGINHAINDILIRMPRKVVIPKKRLGYVAVLQYFARKEGRLKTITGIRKAKGLESFKSISVNKKIGDRCLFAKHGGKSVFDITLFNPDRSKLLADIRRLEQSAAIKTE